MKKTKLYINGNFYNKKKKIKAIRTRNGLIEELFDKYPKDLIENLDKQTEVIDLKDQAVYPGFIDAHLHLLSYCWKKFYEVDLSHVRSNDQLVEVIQKFIRINNIKPGQWVIGSGWNHENFPDKQLPTRDILDSASKEHPIILNRACYHICASNSLALDLANISEQAISVDGGSIDVDQKLVPTGILRENAALLVFDLLPSLKDKEVMKDLIIKGCKDLAKVGITTVHTDDFAFVGDKKALLQAYMELAKEDKLPIKVVLQLRVSCMDDIDLYHNLGLKSWENTKNLRIGPVKFIADGSLGSRTAAMIEPYSDDPSNKGILVIEENSLDQMVKASLKNNYDIAIHAIGDHTMTIVLDVYDKYKQIIEEKGFRPSVIHCQIASKELLQRFKDQNIIANIQPIFLNTDWKSAEDRVGPTRMEYSYCWKKYMDLGIHCAGSSDAPIESFNPLYGIYSSVTRKDLSGQPSEGWYQEECLRLNQSVNLFTRDGAYASLEENHKGAFEIGMTMDCIVLSKDLQKLNSNHIKDVQVINTYINGEKV